MPHTLTLEGTLEAFVQSQMETGRYATVNDVIAASLNVMQDREQHRQALTTALQLGIDDCDAGDVYDAEEVFDEILNHYLALENTL